MVVVLPDVPANATLTNSNALERSNLMSMFLVWLANLSIIVPLIISIMGMMVLARALYCRAREEYKYQELDDNDEPLVSHGQGDYRKDIRPSDLTPIRFAEPPEVEYCSDPNCPTCKGHGTYIDSDGFFDACLRDI